MSRPARTLLWFGTYLAGVGVSLMLFPNVVLHLFGFPPSTQVWVRIVGMLALYLAIYDLAAARNGWDGFIALSVPLRLAAIFFFGAFVAFAGAPRPLVLLAVPDFLFALWTWSALRADARVAVALVARTPVPPEQR